MWGAEVAPDAGDPRHRPPPCVSAPKLTLPGHAESYNPPAEYLPDESERRAWEEAEPAERRGHVLSEAFSSTRDVPFYEEFIRERYERCLDLYMCPRKRQQRLNIDPESLIPKLPKPSTLKPFPQVIMSRGLFSSHNCNPSHFVSPFFVVDCESGRVVCFFFRSFYR
jgi:ribosome biogenesis protein ERB1